MTLASNAHFTEGLWQWVLGMKANIFFVSEKYGDLWHNKLRGRLSGTLQLQLLPCLPISMLVVQ
jgi:hypothetical protein